MGQDRFLSAFRWVGKPAHFRLSDEGIENGYLRCHSTGGGRMDIIRRLVCIAFVIAPLWSYAATSGVYWTFGGATVNYPDALSACRAYNGSTVTVTGTSPAPANFPNYLYCIGYNNSDASQTSATHGSVRWENLNCTAGKEFEQASGTCVTNNCPAAGTQLKDSTYQAQAGISAGVTMCLSGCVAKGAFSASYGGKNYVTGPVVSTGVTCSGSGASSTVPAATDPPLTCDAGKCPGSVTINGTTTAACYACSSVTVPTSTSSAASSATAASGAAPGSPSTSSESSSGTTTCTGSQCTTTKTETKTNPDGSTESKSTTAVEDKSSYCAKNPTTPACKAESDSQWGGACSGGFTCKGDAIQCAQAQAAWKLSCATEIPDGDPNKAIGDQVANNTLLNADPTKTDMPGLGGDLSNAIDQTEHYSGSCPGDIEVAVGDYGSFSVPMSRACPYFEFAGYIGVACALMAAAKIALGA